MGKEGKFGKPFPLFLESWEFVLLSGSCSFCASIYLFLFFISLPDIFPWMNLMTGNLSYKLQVKGPAPFAERNRVRF